MNAFEKRRMLTLKRGKERVIANRHPWIFAGAIHAERGPEDAPFADLVDGEGKRLASGFYSRHSQIRLRALTFGDEVLNEDVLRSRITRAIARRVLDEETNAARMIHAEGDDLSSIVVDRYNDVIVCEIGSRGAEAVKPLLLDAFADARVVYFKNDLPVREIEQLSTSDQVIELSSDQGAPRSLDHSITRFTESGLQFKLDPASGQKTGFFLDQRENRRLARTLASGKRVLNLFSYSGAFGVYMASGGATGVTNVDVSARAIELSRENHALNGVEGEHIVADAFQWVRQQRDQRFHFVVCDPPAFAKSRNEVDRAARGYKDINLHALRLVEPGGMLMTFSCSGHISLDLFQKVIFAAALDAGRRVSVVRRLTAGPDHPVSLYCPEGEYLKGFLLQVT